MNWAARHIAAFRQSGDSGIAQALEAGQFAKAESMSLAARRDGGGPVTGLALALARIGLGRPSEALSALRTALADAPDMAAHHNLLADLLYRQGHHNQALIEYGAAIALMPMDAYSYSAVTGILVDQHKASAIGLASRAVLLEMPADSQTMGDAFMNRAGALLHLERADGALSDYLRAAILDPARAQAFHGAGLCLREQSRHLAERAALSRALAIAPDNSGIKLDLGVAELTLDQRSNGWQLYEARFTTPRFAESLPPSQMPLWQPGQAIKGKRLLLTAEQGLGDSIQFLRYVPLLRRLGARLSLRVPAGLHPLLGPLGAFQPLIDVSGPLPPHDYFCPIMGLPLRVGPEIIPAQTPYLAAPKDRLDYWRQHLPASTSKLRVAINWFGNPAFPRNRQRSIPLSLLQPLLMRPGIQFVVTANNISTDDRMNLALLSNVTVLSALTTTTLGDVAAVLSQCDLVMTTDTALAHLAGALARPVWIALAKVGDFRWRQDQHQSPWYPTAILYRQKILDDWSDVLDRWARDLQTLLDTKQ